MTALAISLCALVSATVFNTSFDRGNELFNAGDFDGAANQFEQLVRDGIVNPDVFYNLGNAYYRQGHLGAAIANYERALHLRPHFDAARQNLDVCIQKTERHLDRPLKPEWEQTLLFWHNGFPPAASFWTAVVCWLAFWSILAARQWRKFAYSRTAAVLALALAAAFGTSAWAKFHPQLLAVAVEKRVPVRYGTSDNETVKFELFEGDRVAIDRKDGDWERVLTADGQRGWTKAAALVHVGPPYERPAQSETEVGSQRHS